LLARLDADDALPASFAEVRMPPGATTPARFVKSWYDSAVPGKVGTVFSGSCEAAHSDTPRIEGARMCTCTGIVLHVCHIANTVFS
jgi:hypothetical protein